MSAPHALVTGGAGFIGSHLVDRLLAEGWDVTVVDDLSGGSSRPTQQVSFHLTEVSTIHDWDFSPIDTVFHLASPVGPVGVLHDPHRTVGTIIRGAEAVARVAQSHEAKLIAIGTSESYGVQVGPSMEDTSCVFAPAYTARQAYGIGKRASETVLALWPEIDARIIRPFNVAGPRQRAGGGFVIPRWIEQASSGKDLTIYQPGTQKRAYCHVLDFVDGIMRVHTSGQRGEVYNLGNPDNVVSLLELSQIFQMAWEQKRGVLPTAKIVNPVELHGPLFKEAPDKVPIIGKAESQLGWKPAMGNEKIILDAIDAA